MKRPVDLVRLFVTRWGMGGWGDNWAVNTSWSGVWERKRQLMPCHADRDDPATGPKLADKISGAIQAMPPVRPILVIPSPEFEISVTCIIEMPGMHRHRQEQVHFSLHLFHTCCAVLLSGRVDGRTRTDGRRR